MTLLSPSPKTATNRSLVRAARARVGRRRGETTLDVLMRDALARFKPKRTGLRELHTRFTVRSTGGCHIDNRPNHNGRGRGGKGKLARGGKKNRRPRGCAASSSFCTHCAVDPGR